MKKVGRWKKVTALATSVVVLGVLGGTQLASGAGSGAGLGGAIASYNGGTINLSQGWGTAAVCAVTAAGTSCFSSQSDYQTWLSSRVQAASPALDAAGPDVSINCATGFDLYQNIDYGGGELVIFDQAAWINLSTYGFSDELSSYKVGACSVAMTDAPNGGGDVYPGATSPGSDVSWIGAAWNDRVQSVYVF
jgi:hypothetical protein